MAEKEESFLDKHKKLYTLVDEALDTMEHHQIGALHSAQKKHLINEKGKIVYKRMDVGYKNKKGEKISAEKVREDMRNQMVTYMGENAIEDKDIKKMFKSIKDPEKKAKLVDGFTSYNNNFMKTQMEAIGGGFKWSHYTNRVLPQLQGQHRKEAEDVTTEHVTTGHIDDIVKMVGVKVTSKPGLIQARDLLAKWSHGEGHISENDAREVLGTLYTGHVKKEKKKEKKAA